MIDLSRTIRESFRDKEVVIVGDLVADQFLNGTISRVSREAPVFILRHDTTVTLPGAAANAAANVASLGGRPVLIGVVGDDRSGDQLKASLAESSVAIDSVATSPGIDTTTKLRVLAGQHYASRQQVIRIDYESGAGLGAEVKDTLRASLRKAAASADVIIVSDYNYGAVFAEIFDDARSIASERSIPIVVDSRYRLMEFSGATSATPNREEVEQILGPDFTADDCSALRERLRLESLLITNGNQGMHLFEAGRPHLVIPVVGSTEPVDVTGAGDTVIAVFSLGLASGLSFADAARIANHAGGLVVMKKYTASITADELVGSIQAEPQTLATFRSAQ